MILTVICMIFVIFLDQWTKYLTFKHIPLHASHTIIEGWLDFTYVQNKGAGWGLFAGRQGFFIIFTLVIVGFIFYRLSKNPRPRLLTSIIYGVFLGGSLGNFIDRLRLGYVIDMIHVRFIDFPVFNVADMALSLSVFVMMIIVLLSKEEDLLL